jgi:hypothetical protein
MTWMDDFEFRAAPLLRINDEYIKTFAVFKLVPTLEKFKCGMFEIEGQVGWYWRTALTWAKQATQSDFDAYATKRLSDHVGYSRRHAESCGVIDRLFDKAMFAQCEFEEVIAAMAFLTDSKEIPADLVEQRDATTFIDLTARIDSPKILKVDNDFFPVLNRLWTFERQDDVVLKKIPVGVVTREFNLRRLAFWFQHKDVTLVELNEALETRNGDLLDWRRENMFSTWAEEAKDDAHVPEDIFPECTGAGGRTFVLRPNNGGKAPRKIKCANSA